MKELLNWYVIITVLFLKLGCLGFWRLCPVFNFPNFGFLQNKMNFILKEDLVFGSLVAFHTVFGFSSCGN